MGIKCARSGGYTARPLMLIGIECVRYLKSMCTYLGTRSRQLVVIKCTRPLKLVAIECARELKLFSTYLVEVMKCTRSCS